MLARKPCLAALAFSALLLTPSAWAFRCNSFVIDAGMAKPEVLRKCGTPSLQEQRLDRRVIRLRVPAAPNSGLPPGSTVELERERQVLIEEWVYNFGPQQFMQQLVFEDGRLVSVKDLGYGS
ncbi:DUF2845 domain-containing protein [Paucibacter sp. B51]|uniref:DUF2845 domain-containing protein n=1 Tax=Paucibacter sp. B51 TaxID=2993315 RepID=UPI0022EBC214|nr:DUF2845 domain-containing protein [Paucibacter sp. B51]